MFMWLCTETSARYSKALVIWFTQCINTVLITGRCTDVTAQWTKYRMFSSDWSHNNNQKTLFSSSFYSLYTLLNSKALFFIHVIVIIHCNVQVYYRFYNFVISIQVLSYNIFRLYFAFREMQYRYSDCKL